MYENEALADKVWLAAGTFDDDPRCQPQYHIFVSSKAGWLEINDDLPQFDELPPAL